MAITLTGNKYTGTLSAVGTTTLTDSGATFSSGDFAVPRMAYLYRSGDPVGIARVNSYSSGTVLNLDTPFFDYDGNEVTQVSGDTYYISQTASEVATTGWAVSGKVVTITDSVNFGTSGSKTGLFLHMEDYYITYDIALVNATPSLSFVGGFTTFGNPLDLKNRVTGSGCRIHSSVNTSQGELIQINNSAASMMHFGTVFSANGHLCRVGGGLSSTRTNGFWHVYVNCVSDGVDIVGAAGTGVNTWPARPSFQRVINLTSSGAGINFMNVRWLDGYVEGGVFSGSGNALATTGVVESNAAFTGNFEALAGERLRIIDNPLAIFRSSNNIHTNVLNCYNVLIPDSLKLMITGVYTSNAYNTNGTLNLYWREQYTGLTNGTKYAVKNNVPSTVASGTIGAGGDIELELLYQTRTFPTTTTTSDTFYNGWEVGFYQYGKQIIYLTPDVFNDSQAGQTVKNIVFGGPLAQSSDSLITEATKATVAAYTNLSTAQKAYDRSCSELEDAYDAESTLIIGRVGNQLDLDGGSATAVVYDSTASAVWDYTGTTLTIDHTSDYTGGCTGTGAFTISGALGLNGGTFDNSGGVVYDSSKTTITGINVTNGLDFTTAGTYTLDGCTIDEVTNSSGGAVTLNVINGGTITTNTGPSITVNYPVDVTVDSLVTGSYVRVEKVSDQSLVLEGSESGNEVTGSWNYTGDLAVKIIVRLHGYKTYETTGTITAQGLTVSTIQQSDPFVVANFATASAYTGITEDFSARTVSLTTSHAVQEVYDYLSAKAMASGNMTYDMIGTSTNGVEMHFDSDVTVGAGGTLTSTTQTASFDGGGSITTSGGGTISAPVGVTTGGQLIVADLDDVTGQVTLTGSGDWEINAAGASPSGSAGASATIEITTASPGDTFDFAAFTFNAATVIENSSGSNVTVNILPGATVPTKLETSGTITFTQTAPVTATLVTGTRVQLYNVTKAAELDNSVVSGGAYSYDADTSTAGVDVGDTLRLRHVYVSGTSCNQPESLTGTLTATGLSFSATQTACPVYEGNLIDGSTVTEFSADYPNVQVDINDPDNTTTVQRLYAWFTYNMSTEQGIRNFYGGMIADDEVNYQIVTSVMDLKLDNVSANPVVITGARIYRDDEATVIASGSIQIDPLKAYLARATAMETKIDTLQSTVDGTLDANIVQVGGTAVTGSGTAGDPWGP